MCFNVAFNIVAHLFIFSLFSFSLFTFFLYSFIFYNCFSLKIVLLWELFCSIKPFVQFHILYIFTLLKSVGFILIKLI